MSSSWETTTSVNAVILAYVIGAVCLAICLGVVSFFVCHSRLIELGEDGGPKPSIAQKLN